MRTPDMQTLGENEIPTLDMIQEDLKYNPPGQGAFDFHMEFMCNAPFYLTYLLARLERAEKSFWRRLFSRETVETRFHELVSACRKEYFALEELAKKRVA